MYISYSLILGYLFFNKFSLNYNIDLLPNLVNTLLPFMNNTYNFINSYTYNFELIFINNNLFDLINVDILILNKSFLIILITFLIILVNIMNSLFFSNKLFTLYNFLINLQ